MEPRAPGNIVLKLAITGNTSDYSLIQKSLADLSGLELVISGGSQQLNSLVKRWTQQKGVEHIEFVQSPATNEMLIKICTHVVIFGEVDNLVDLAKKYKKRYRVVSIS